MWRGYISHVITNIGGVYETRKSSEQEGVIYTPVPKGMQRFALQFLNEHAFSSPQWLMDPSILNRIEPTGAIERAKAIQVRSLRNLLDDDRLIRLVEANDVYGDNTYQVTEMLTNLRKGLFSELYKGQNTDAYRRNIQRAYVEIAGEYINSLEKDKKEDVVLSDVIALLRGEITVLAKDLSRYGRSNDTLTAYHWDDLSARIESILNSK